MLGKKRFVGYIEKSNLFGLLCKLLVSILYIMVLLVVKNRVVDTSALSRLALKLENQSHVSEPFHS